jgi:hypothetical protein
VKTAWTAALGLRPCGGTETKGTATQLTLQPGPAVVGEPPAGLLQLEYFTGGRQMKNDGFFFDLNCTADVLSNDDQ